MEAVKNMYCTIKHEIELRDLLIKELLKVSHSSLNGDDNLLFGVKFAECQSKRAMCHFMRSANCK